MFKMKEMVLNSMVEMFNLQCRECSALLDIGSFLFVRSMVYSNKVGFYCNRCGLKIHGKSTKYGEILKYGNATSFD